MKIYILYELYYDYCDEWDCIVNAYDSEEKAIMAQILLEDSDIKYKVNPEQYHTRIDERELL
jgi:hypothetical protein